MDVTVDLFMELEDLYGVKSRHLRFLNSSLAGDWRKAVAGEHGGIWEQRGERFYLRDQEGLKKPLGLLVPSRRQILIWTMIGFANELVLEVGHDALDEFLQKHIDNPTARANLEEVFLGTVAGGTGLKAFGGIAVCSGEENRFIGRFLPVLTAFAASDPRTSGSDAEKREAADCFLREIDDFRQYLYSDVFLFRKFNRDIKELLNIKRLP